MTPLPFVTLTTSRAAAHQFLFAAAPPPPSGSPSTERTGIRDLEDRAIAEGRAHERVLEAEWESRESERDGNYVRREGGGERMCKACDRECRFRRRGEREDVVWREKGCIGVRLESMIMRREQCRNGDDAPARIPSRCPRRERW